MDYESLGWTSPGLFPPQGGTMAGGDATTEQHRWEMEVSTIGRGDVSGVTGGGGDVCLPPPKLYSPIYRNSSDIGAVSGCGVATGSAGGQYMSVAGRIRF